MVSIMFFFATFKHSIFNVEYFCGHYFLVGIFVLSLTDCTVAGNTRSLLELANTKFGQCQEEEELDLEQR